MAGKSKPNDGQPKKSIVLRIFILIVAVLMLVGVIAFPFMTSGLFG